VTMIRAFAMLGKGHELASKYRRKMFNFMHWQSDRCCDVTPTVNLAKAYRTIYWERFIVVGPMGE